MTNNLEKTDRNRNVLVVNNIHKDHKIYSPVTIYEILRDEIITTGGFAVIRRFVVRGIKHSDSDEIKTLVMVNKTAEDQRLFW